MIKKKVNFIELVFLTINIRLKNIRNMKKRLTIFRCPYGFLSVKEKKYRKLGNETFIYV